MGLRIILRKRREYSPFRRALLSIIRLPGTDSLVLCSGYISESTTYRISEDELLAALADGCRSGSLTVIAGKLHAQWNSRYMDFLRRLRAEGLDLVAYKAPRKNWHAKVAIKLRGDEPVAAIVGSSNLTRPAYAEHAEPFNYECDVIMWSNSIDALVRGQFSEFGAGESNPFEVVDAILDPRIEQPSEDQRLRDLLTEIRRIVRNFRPIGL